MSGEIVQLDGVLELSPLLGILGHRVEDVLYVAIEFVDESGPADAVVGVDATKQRIKFTSLQNQLAQTRQE